MSCADAPAPAGAEPATRARSCAPLHVPCRPLHPQVPQEDPHRNGRHFQDRHEGRKVPFHRDPGGIGKGDGGEEGDHRNRTEVGGQRPGIHRIEACQVAGRPPRGEGGEEPEEEGHGRREEHLAQGGLGKGDPALQPDGEKEVDGERLVQRLGHLQIAPDQRCRHPQGKGKDHGREKVRGEDFSERHPGRTGRRGWKGERTKEGRRDPRR